MQAPTGCSGVQAFPNSGQPAGVILPCSTSPQRQPLASFPPIFGTLYFLRALKAAYSSLRSMPEFSRTPIPRHLASQGSMYFATRALACGLPSSVTMPGGIGCTR